MTKETARKGKKGQWYKSAEPVALKGGIVPADTPFVSDADPGDTWEEIEAEDAAAQTASTTTTPTDEAFDAASKYAVEAYCLIKGIDIRQLSAKEDFVAAAKAFNDPTR